MRLRCPACAAEFSLDAAVADDAGRELMALLADLPRELSRPLVAYLGLWRSDKRALAWERALRIARETLALEPDPVRLGTALAATVESIRRKWDAAGRRPLDQHNYLLAVLEGTPAGGAPRAAAGAATPRLAPPARRSATLDAVAALQEAASGRPGLAAAGGGGGPSGVAVAAPGVEPGGGYDRGGAGGVAGGAGRPPGVVGGAGYRAGTAGVRGAIWPAHPLAGSGTITGGAAAAAGTAGVARAGETHPAGTRGAGVPARPPRRLREIVAGARPGGLRGRTGAALAALGQDAEQRGADSGAGASSGRRVQR